MGQGQSQQSPVSPRPVPLLGDPLAPAEGPVMCVCAGMGVGGQAWGPLWGVSLDGSPQKLTFKVDFFFFFLAEPMASGSFQAGDRTHATELT